MRELPPKVADATLDAKTSIDTAIAKANDGNLEEYRRWITLARLHIEAVEMMMGWRRSE